MPSVGISVVIPVYKNPSSALRAVFSVLRQTRPAHEIILVDDGSPDSILHKIEHSIGKCRSEIPIRLKRLAANVGPGGARHAGANAATGTHVAFLDADDLWHRAKIERALDAIERHDADLIGHARPWAFHIPRQALIDLPDDVKLSRLRPHDFLKRNPIPTSSIVARLSITQEMFRFGGRKSEDYMALVIASKMTRSIYYIEADLCWALKPPFGHSGAGADQVKIYRASLTNMLKLHRERLISTRELAVYMCFLAARAPIGLVRHWHYRRLYGHAGSEHA